MSDLIDDPIPGENAPEFTVTELSGAIKRTIEGEFGHVRVRGEIGRVSRPRSGHIYLDLKDDRAVLSGVIWKGVAARLATQPEEGLEVVATGRLTTFGGQSKYQIVIEDIAPAGMGALMAMLEKRKAALMAEGLFAPDRKQALPYLPEVIGVVTSPSGAVIRDILHRLRDRFPRKVLIWPVAVQGAKCAPEVARAIRGFNALTPGGALPRPDLLIVARGGGSVEDLWGFNEEEVVRAAADSAIPLISAVGHETDTTLIDHVADQRAPTPTAAAELAVPVRLELLAWTGEQEARLKRALSQIVAQRRQRLADLARALPRAQTLLDTPRQRLDRAGEQLPAALRQTTQRRRIRLSEAAAGLRPQTLRAKLTPMHDRIDATGARLTPALSRVLRQYRKDLDKAGQRLMTGRMGEAVLRHKHDLGELDARLLNAFASATIRQRTRLDALDRTRQNLGYTETLKRGFAVVRGDGAVVTNCKAAKAAASLEIEFADGRLVTGGGAPLPKKATPKKPPSGQGTLF